MSITRKRFLQAMVVAVATVALSLGVAVPAFAATPTNPDYAVSTYSTSEYDQHVVVTVDYGQAVDVVDDVTGITVTIAGRDITSDAYHRPMTVSANGTKLVLDIGGVKTKDASNHWTVDAFTAQYSGVITVTGTPENVEVNQEAVGALNLNTVIPTGVALTKTNEGTSTVTATVSHVSNVRGMVHIGIYKEEDGTLIPINPEAGTIGCYTYTTHAHAFTTMVASDYAAAIAGLSLPDGYSITQNGATVTLTSTDANAKLYMYIFDANSLRTLNTDYTAVVNTNTGELNQDGTPNTNQG